MVSSGQAVEFKEIRLIASKQKLLINRHIQAPQVMLIDHDGNNLGITDTREALAQAKQQKLDLVVVSQTGETPVAKILDHGKLQYQKSKRQKQTSRPSVKEVKFRPNIGEADYAQRINRAVQWLDKGNSVKFLVRLRGREHQHRDRAKDLLNRVVEDLSEAGKVQSFDQRTLQLMVAPG